jgi:adenylate cyclase
MSPGAFRTAIDRFYAVAANVVFAHDGVIDKFVGDEVVALFFPLIAGDRHAAQAVAAAQALLRATGHGDPDGPWVPVGIGVHTGPAWFGTVGEEPHVELTALGDTVNTAARLAAAAGAGEILIGLATITASGFHGGEPRALDLKGKAAPFEARSVRARPA